MGANVTGAGTSVIHIRGVKELGSLDHEIIPDRLECATYLLAFAVSRGNGSVKNVIPEHNIALISLLKDTGIKIRQHDTSIEIVASDCHYLPIHAWQEDALSESCRRLLRSRQPQVAKKHVLVGGKLY